MRRFTWTLGFIILCTVLPFLSLSAKAADTKTKLTDWNYQVYMASFTGVTSYKVDVAGLANGKFSARQSVMLDSWSVNSQGGNAVFTISQTTFTYGAATTTAGFNNAYPGSLYKATQAPDISTSTIIDVPSGASGWDEPKEYVVNPIFNFTSVDASAIVHLYVTIGVPR